MESVRLIISIPYGIESPHPRIVTIAAYNSAARKFALLVCPDMFGIKLGVPLLKLAFFPGTSGGPASFCRGEGRRNPPATYRWTYRGGFQPWRSRQHVRCECRLAYRCGGAATEGRTAEQVSSWTQLLHQ